MDVIDAAAIVGAIGVLAFFTVLFIMHLLGAGQ